MAEPNKTYKLADEQATPRMIEKPTAPIAMNEGPHRDVYLKNCVSCHTTRYVTMQPRFSQKVWKAEVTKMVTAYKAPVTPADQNQIVEYLTAAYGTPNTK